MNNKETLPTTGARMSASTKVRIVNPLLSTTLNIASYFHVVPFCFKFNKHIGKECLIPFHNLRKVFCVIIHFYVILENLKEFKGHYENLVETLAKDGMSVAFPQAFVLFGDVGSFIFYTSLIWTIWRKQNALEEFIQKTSVQYERRMEIKLRIFSGISFCAIGSVLGFAYYDTIGEALKLFKFSSIFATVSSIAILYNAFLTHATFSLILCIALVLNNYVNRLRTDLERFTEPEKVPEVLDSFRDLKGIQQDVEDLFGNNFLAYYLTVISYCGIFPYGSIWFSRSAVVWNLSYFWLSAGIFFICARLHFNTQRSMQNWISTVQRRRDLGKDTRSELTAVFVENLMDPFGISCRVFIVTYGFLGSSFSLILTYGIVIFQVLMNTKPK